MITLPDDKELNKLYDWAMNEDNGGTTHYPGLTYEHGIKDVLDWIQGHITRPDLVK